MLSGKPCLFVIPFIFVLASCGGGSSGDDADTTAPTVSSVTPVDGATDIARDSVITATFDEDLFATTVDDTSFTLSGNSAATGIVTFEGSTNVASFTPDSKLDLLTAYTATMTTAITDLSGNGLASNHSWSFTTDDGAWGEAGTIDYDGDNASNATSPRIAFDSSGNAMAVWYQSDGSRNNIWAHRYEVGTGWAGPESIDNDAGNAEDPQIAFDSSGNAIAVWYQWDGNLFSIYANRYEVGTEWDDTAAKTIVNDDTTNALNPQIAFDGSGNAIAVWRQFDGNRINIWANRYEVGTGWDDTPAEMIGNNFGRKVEHPQIAVDGSGNAFVVWYQHDDVNRSYIWANRYVVGTGWDKAGPKSIDNDAGDAVNPQIAVDGSGNAIAVWSQNDGSRDSIYANRFE